VLRGDMNPVQLSVIAGASQQVIASSYEHLTRVVPSPFRILRSSRVTGCRFSRREARWPLPGVGATLLSRHASLPGEHRRSLWSRVQQRRGRFHFVTPIAQRRYLFRYSTKGALEACPSRLSSSQPSLEAAVNDGDAIPNADRVQRSGMYPPVSTVVRQRLRWSTRLTTHCLGIRRACI